MYKKILIIKFWALGDILMATPLLRALKERYPGCSICWLVDSHFAGALEGNPLLDEVIRFDSGAWRRDYRYGKLAKYVDTGRRLRRCLTEKHFDLTICLTAEKWWMQWFMTAPLSVGLFPSETPGFLGRFFTHAIPMPAKPKPHSTDHYLQTIRALGETGDFDKRMVCTPTPQRVSEVDEFLAQQPGFDAARPTIVLHPGTSQPGKCWPASSYTGLIDILGPGCNFVITGSPAEEELAISIKQASKPAASVIVATGKLTEFGQTAALVSRAALVVSGDTSLLHVASALETPLVGIYGSTRPGINEPLFGPRVLLYDDSVQCAPCYKSSCPLKGADFMKCQAAVTPENTAAAVRSLMH